MKKSFILPYLIVLLLFSIGVSDVMAQKRKATGRVAGNTIVNNFEGKLVYRSIDAHSEAVLKNSFGQAYNGERTYIVFVKDEKMHVYDERCALHKIFDIPNNRYIIYSSVTGQGVRYNLKDYSDVLKTYSNDSQVQRITWKPDIPVTYKGDKLTHREGRLSNIKPDDVNTVGKIQGSLNIYTSDIIKLPDVVAYFYGGVENYGVIKKMVVDQEIISKYVGHMRSVTAMELVAMDVTSPEDSYFSVPSEIKIKDNDTKHQNTVSFFEKHNKVMEEMGYTQGEPAQNVMLSIKDEWAYVKDWEDIYVEIFKQEETPSSNVLTTILDGLLEITATVYDDIEKMTEAAKKQKQVAFAKNSSDNVPMSEFDKEEGNSSTSAKAEPQKKEKKVKPLSYYQRRYDAVIEKLKNEFKRWSNGKNHGKKNAKGELVFLRIPEHWGTYSDIEMMGIHRAIHGYKVDAINERRRAKKVGWELVKSIYEDAKEEIWEGLYMDNGKIKRYKQ